MTTTTSAPNPITRRDLAIVGVAAVVTALQAFVPLLGEPGYEAAEFQALLLIVATVVAASARREDPDGASVAPAALILAGFVWCVDVAILFAVSLARGLCDAGDGLLWLMVLPLPSAVLAAAWIDALSAAFKRRRTVLGAFILVALANLAAELYVVWREPVVFVFNMLLGYFPGPVYDRAVRFTPALMASRAEALAFAAALFGFAVLFRGRRAAHAGRRRTGVLVAVAGLLAYGTLALFGEELGNRSERAWIERELGGVMRGPHVVMRYPEDLPEREARLQLLDLEYRFDRQSRYLGLADPEPLTAFYYRGAAEKKRLMGAGDTQYADCGNREMHMNIEDPPHSVLKHEIVHVLASPWGLPGLGFSPMLGLTEGLAVASEVWRDDWTIPQWAAAMKGVGRLPDIAAISGPTGFWRLSGARSYLAWGGFVTWLVERFGMESVSRAYRDGDFDAAFGKPVETLAKEWEASLDAVEVPDDLARLAAYRFFRPSIFEGRCARRVETLSEDAERAQDRGRKRLSARLLAEAVELAGGDSRQRRDLMFTLLNAGTFDEALEQAEFIEQKEGAHFREAPASGKPVQGDLLSATYAVMVKAQVAWLRGDGATARALYADVLAWGVADSARRTAAVALYALDRPDIEPMIRAYIADPRDRAGEYRLHEALAVSPDDAVVRYLLGRRLAGNGARAEAATCFRAALESGLPDRVLSVEAWRSLGRVLYEEGRYDEAVAIFTDGLPSGASEGLKLEAAEWVERCRFAASFPWPES